MSESARNNIISLGIANAENNAENIEANYLIYPVPDSNYIRVLSDRQNVTFYCYAVYEK